MRGKHDMKITERIKRLFSKRETSKEQEAKYIEIPLFYRDGETGLPSEVKAIMYILSCPVCGKAVKRSDTYCAECGNKVAI